MNGQNKLVLHYTRLKRLSSDKHLTLFGTFVSNEENEVLWILTNREAHSTVLSKKPQKSATVTISNIFGIFVSQKNKPVTVKNSETFLSRHKNLTTIKEWSLHHCCWPEEAKRAKNSHQQQRL